MYINNKIYHMSLLACMLSVLLISIFLPYTQNSAFQHLAVEVPGEGTGSQWLEAVDPAEYAKLK